MQACKLQLRAKIHFETGLVINELLQDAFCLLFLLILQPLAFRYAAPIIPAPLPYMFLLSYLLAGI